MTVYVKAGRLSEHEIPSKSESWSCHNIDLPIHMASTKNRQTVFLEIRFLFQGIPVQDRILQDLLASQDVISPNWLLSSPMSLHFSIRLIALVAMFTQGE